MASTKRPSFLADVFWWSVVIGVALFVLEAFP